MNSPGKYKNPLDVVVRTVSEEGVTALYKGFVPNVIRLSAFNMVLQVTIEKIKKWYF